MKSTFVTLGFKVISFDDEKEMDDLPHPDVVLGGKPLTPQEVEYKKKHGHYPWRDNKNREGK